MSRWSTLPQSVICINTGQVYSSINDAARDTGMQASSIMRAIKKGHMCAGKYWKLLPADLDGIALEQWRMGQLLSCIGYKMMRNEEDVTCAK